MREEEPEVLSMNNSLGVCYFCPFRGQLEGKFVRNVCLLISGVTGKLAAKTFENPFPRGLAFGESA